MSELISVIIPVYNVEKYLKKCVDSVLCQTYENLEIILVDDGSPDGCGAICDEYAKQDGRVVVIHKENGGLSSARNAGLDVMTGEYVAFLDSDDWVEPNMYGTLLANLKRFQSDISVGGVADDLETSEGTHTTHTSQYGEEPFAENKVDAMRRFFSGAYAAWDKLYRASLFCGIRFPEGEINEDEAIALYLFEKCDAVCYTNEVLYHYLKRENRKNTITAESFSKKKLAWQKHCRNNLAYVRKNHPELVSVAALKCRGSLIWSLSEIALLKNQEEYAKEVQDLMGEIKRNKDLTLPPFQSRKEKLYYHTLRLFGYPSFRALICGKRKVFHG